MSIFIDPNTLFPIWIKFSPIVNNNGNVIAVKVLPDDAQGEFVKKLFCLARGRDYDKYSKILEEASVINHITGKPILDARSYYKLLALNFFALWGVFNVADKSEIDKTKLTEVTEESVMRSDFSVIRSLGVKWIKTVTGVIKVEE